MLFIIVISGLVGGALALAWFMAKKKEGPTEAEKKDWP